MSHDIPQSVSQGVNGAQDQENRRIAEIADELCRLCRLYEAQSGTVETNVTPLEVEQRQAEKMAKAGGYWIPMSQVFDLGVPGPSGNENDTYVSDEAVFKVNNLLNSGSIVAQLRKVVMHNILFPDTAYRFHGFTGFDSRLVQPIFRQVRVEHASPATQVMITTVFAKYCVSN